MGTGRWVEAMARQAARPPLKGKETSSRRWVGLGGPDIGMPPVRGLETASPGATRRSLGAAGRDRDPRRLRRQVSPIAASAAGGGGHPGVVGPGPPHPRCRRPAGCPGLSRRPRPVPGQGDHRRPDEAGKLLMESRSWSSAAQRPIAACHRRRSGVPETTRARASGVVGFCVGAGGPVPGLAQARGRAGRGLGCMAASPGRAGWDLCGAGSGAGRRASRGRRVFAERTTLRPPGNWSTAWSASCATPASTSPSPLPRVTHCLLQHGSRPEGPRRRGGRALPGKRTLEFLRQHLGQTS